jgi:hypothetical protein
MSDAERRQLKQRLLPVLPEAEATRIVWNIASRKLLRKLVSQQTFTAMSPTDLLLFIRQKLAAGGPPVPAPGARQPISQATAQQPPQSRAQQPSSSGAQQTTRRSTRSTRTEPARNWSTQSTLPVAVRGGPPVPARQPLSARAVSSWSDVAQTLSVCAAKVQVRRVAELRVNATGAVQLMLHPYLRQLRGTKLA